MTVIQAVATNTGLDRLAQHMVHLNAAVQIVSFRLGEAGFQQIGLVKVPKVPDPTRTRIESDGMALSGTLTFTNGSPNVSASGGSFTTQVVAGQYVRFDTDFMWVQVLSVTDNNHLVLQASYTGTGGTGSGSFSATGQFVFRKLIPGLDLVFGGVGSGQAQATAFLDFSEGNTNTFGANPQYFEIGLFDAQENMIAYGTFPGETKNNGIQFNKVCKTTFSRPV